MDGIILFKGSK